jgi:hypothetical protein
MCLPRRFIAGVGCAVAVLAGARPAAGQTEPPVLGSLRTPPSPAFTVVGIEPSAVERPTTPADAALSFLNTFRQSAVPKEYAFEASPYWLVAQPDLSWRDDLTRSVGESIKRTLSLSIATAETGTSGSPVTAMGIGVRGLVSSGRMTQATEDALTELERTLSQTGDLFLRLVGEAGLDALDVRLRNGEIAEAAYEAEKARLTARVLESDDYRNAMARVEDIAAKREGFFLEVAAGLVWDFARGRWESREFRRRGIWATPSYEFGPWNVLGVLRYVDDTATPNQDAIDWGGRTMYSTADYSLSLEFVERSPIDQTTTLRRSHRFVGIAEYRVSPATWVIASFGKDRRKTGTDETLVAQLGLAFSFSKDRYRF